MCFTPFMAERHLFTYHAHPLRGFPWQVSRSADHPVPADRLLFCRAVRCVRSSDRAAADGLRERRGWDSSSCGITSAESMPGSVKNMQSGGWEPGALSGVLFRNIAEGERRFPFPIVILKRLCYNIYVISIGPFPKHDGSFRRKVKSIFCRYQDDRIRKMPKTEDTL